MRLPGRLLIIAALCAMSMPLSQAAAQSVTQLRLTPGQWKCLGNTIDSMIVAHERTPAAAFEVQLSCAEFAEAQRLMSTMSALELSRPFGESNTHEASARVSNSAPLLNRDNAHLDAPRVTSGVFESNSAEVAPRSVQPQPAQPQPALPPKPLPRIVDWQHDPGAAVGPEDADRLALTALPVNLTSAQLSCLRSHLPELIGEAGEVAVFRFSQCPP